jgi:hypothetical protein
VRAMVASPFGGFLGGSLGGVLQIFNAAGGCGNENATTKPVPLGPARGVRTFEAAIWRGDALYVSDDEQRVWRVPTLP